jgi:hypothetical protein
MLATLAVAFAACAPPTTLKNVQVAPETPRPKLKNVIVVGLVKNPATRGNYEFDGAMVGMLVDSRTEVRAVPPSAYGGYYGYAGWAGPMAYSPGYLESTTTVVVDTRLFRTAGDGAPVFSATSESVDPRSAKDVTEQLSKLTVAELRKDGFV